MSERKQPMPKGTKKLKQYNICGIYFLIHKECVVYVGQAKDIHSRIGTHARENKKIFDEVKYLEHPIENIDRMEKYLIAYFQPAYNKTHTSFASNYTNYLKKDVSHLTCKEFIECNNCNISLKKPSND